MAKIMVKGTGGNLDYLAIARKGNLVLSIKPNAIADGVKLNVKNVTYFGARLRSAPAGHAFKESDAESGFVSFGNFQPDDKWGGIEWDKVDSERASGQEGVFLRGSLNTEADKVLDAFVNGKITERFAEYLYEKAGPNVAFVATKEEIAAWLEETYAPQLKIMVAKIKEANEAQKQLEVAVEGSVGVFASQTKLLKDIFKSLKKPENPADIEDQTDYAPHGNQDDDIPE